MSYYKSIVWILVLILLFIDVPTTDSPKSYDFDDEFGWKTIVADFLEADETDLDRELVKEILIEVGLWYRDAVVYLWQEYVMANLLEVLIEGKT